ncbi:hypothetical protein [Mesorhizobium delmotii]|nr:hypothetical protein [Mesorhizobium delmotii]
MINLIGGVAAFFLAASPLHAGELSVMAGESIDLGGFAASYTTPTKMTAIG